MSLGKTKLHNVKVLVSKALIDWYINHDEFLLVNNMLKEYKMMKEKIKILKMLCNVLYKHNENLLC